MVGRTTHAEHDTAMLHRAIIVKEESAHGANVWLLSVIEQVIKPARRYDFGVII